MPTEKKTKTRAPRQPADHKAPAEVLRAEALAERPAGADLLIAPEKLRPAQRAKLLKLATTLEGDAAALGEGNFEVGLDLVVRIDRLLEKHFALDREAYATWTTVAGGGPGPEERIVELFSWYATVLGE